ncbi:MAG TPA: UrcA family protein [Steroidobacteraceae bacterium]|nr:UrcA family protein [Steroidobacteraceae bacterium]
MTTVNVGFAILAFGVLASGNAIAAPQSQTETVEVRYTRAALDAPGGAERLYRRIQAAARQACGDSDPRDIVRYFMFKGCYQNALDAAVEKVNASTLTALHHKAQRTAPG